MMEKVAQFLKSFISPALPTAKARGSTPFEAEMPPGPIFQKVNF